MSTEYTTSNAIYTSGILTTTSNGTTVSWDTIAPTGDGESASWDNLTCDWSACWPNYYYHWCGEGYRVPKIETAFKIVQKLMELKIATFKTVKEFVELVNEISEVL